MDIVWAYVRNLLLNPWVTNYVAPAFMGAWLALITANIISIRDVNRFYVMRSDWAAILGLHKLAKFIEKRWKKPVERVTRFTSNPPLIQR